MPPIEEDMILEEKLQQIVSTFREQLSTLSILEYEALHLRFYEGMGYDQIAELMAINEQSARNLVTRAIHKLRRSFPVAFSLLIILAYFLVTLL